MRNLIITLAAFATLNSCRLLSERSNKRVHRALTANEKLSISQGNSVEKIDTVKRKQNLEFGPITVKPNGKSIAVTEHGLWKFYISGSLFNTVNFDIGVSSIYNDNGQLFSKSYDLSKLEKSIPPAPGEIIEQRIVNFRNGSILDTTYVFHYFTRINEHGKRKSVRGRNFISDGWNGAKAAPRQRR